ncbi:hypothetical protein LWI29_024954 [Acer saccharum]|uniref:Prephenate dehydratase domain-containing protein n=1 Tax=Acer saccharum TaxID=4024 RepID=A0AA39RSS4_ACESA|nr:hypothetical protein LWI29_024954 [Acer saccharum]
MMIWAFYLALKPIQEKRHIQLHNLITLTNCRTFVCNRPSSSSSDVSKVRVAYQGIPGAYSEAAALKAYLKSETVPCEQFEAAFKMVASSDERDTGAVASARAAKIYGLNVLAEKI